MTCSNQQIAGISYDGGYADYMLAPQEALAAIPEELDAVNAAPLLCAGITTFNALRNSGARAGDLVAVQGVGGLGHLAIQYARHMGFHTVALSGSDEKRELASELGAHEFVDSSRENPVEFLQQRGGAKLILTTAPNAEAMSAVIDGLAVGGKLLVVAATPDAIEVSPFQLLMARRSVSGWPSGTPRDSEDAMSFTARTGSRAYIETYPLDQVQQAFERMVNNEARFRVVLTMK